MLSVSKLVNVTISLSALAAAGRSFGTLMIAGDSGVINGLERLRSYSNIESVASDFGTSAPEYKAASLYFGQTPKPSSLMIGAYLRTAQSGMNLGEILSPAQRVLASFTAISTGVMGIAIDGTTQNMSAIDFSAATNLNGVATAVNAVLTGAVCSWNGSQFIIKSNSTGAGVKASGTILFTGTGADGDTLTVEGTVITFKSSSPTGSQVLIGATALETANNLLAFLQSSVDSNIDKCTYSIFGATITATYKTVGTAGNAFTLARSSSAITLSGATLASGANGSSVGYGSAGSGSGTDISGLLGLTSALSIALVPGFSSETPVACATALAIKSTAWYGLMFASSTMPTDAQSLAVSDFAESQTITRLYGVTTQDTSVESSLVGNDLASLMKSKGYDQSFCQFSTSSPYAVASVFGRAFSVDFTAQNSTIDLMYKQMPGLDPEDLTDGVADVLKSKNCNVFAKYDNGTQLFQYGNCSSGEFIDTIQGVDWFQNQVQTNCFNVLYTSTTKVPQTDAGINQLTNACTGACDDAVNNNLAAPGTWNGPSFGAIKTGQYLKAGYYVFAPSVATQSQADRDARKSPPIQIALKLAGAVNTVDVLVTVNQ